MKNFLFEDIIEAYKNAKENKVDTINHKIFEKDFEKNLFDLHQEIVFWKYNPWTSICFVNYNPVIREIFAWDFKDRVVHHLLFNYINDFMDEYFIYDSYSCRTWKWTLFWVDRMKKFVKQSSENFEKKIYVLQLDISWYFMSLNRKILFDNLKIFLERRFLDKNFLRKLTNEKIFFYYKKFFRDEKNFSKDFLINNLEKRKKILNFLLYLSNRIIFHDPTKDCIKKSKNFEYKLIPYWKSLFTAQKWCGLPIWNLTSQLFWNFYMDWLDKFIKNDLWIDYYWRYVDDFVLIDNNKKKLLSLIPKIENFLDEKLNLKLNKKKNNNSGF